MSSSSTSPAVPLDAEKSANLDTVFRQYNLQQANTYAIVRKSYSQRLYDEVIRYHTSNNPNASFDVLLDVGCGPGHATRDLAMHFNHATGVDPGVEMVAQAAAIGGKTKAGNDVKFEVAPAEDLTSAQSVEEGSVDILSAAMAAHWFKMDKFWAQAARMLKPGGTVALWTQSSLYCHPSTPNAAAVQKAMSTLEDNYLGPYELPSNNISRGLYVKLALPWQVDPPVPAFQEANYVRREWNRDGRLEPGENEFFGRNWEASLMGVAKGLSTSSMVTRWREAHPDLVGTEDDCVRKTMKEVAAAMGVGGSEADLQQTTLKCGAATVLLLFTKS